MALTLQTLRREAEASLDDRAIYVASAGASTSFTSPQLVNATTGAAVTSINGAWSYIATGATAQQQKRVRTNGHTPSTGVALIYPDWSAPVPGAEIEITRLFPAASGTDVASPGQDISYRALINTSLRRYPIPDQITVATVAGAYSYSLSTYATWLTSLDRVLRIGGPPLVSGYPARDDAFRGFRLEFDAGVPTLRLRAAYAATSEAIRIDVVRPANTSGSRTSWSSSRPRRTRHWQTVGTTAPTGRRWLPIRRSRRRRRSSGWTAVRAGCRKKRRSRWRGRRRWHGQSSTS
jgi:hypothetical protein